MSRQDILRNLLLVLSVCRKNYVSGDKLSHFGISLRFLADGRLEMVLFNDLIDKSLYYFKQAIFTEIDDQVWRSNIRVYEKSIQYRSGYYLRNYIGDYLCKDGFIDTKGIFFDYIVINSTMEIYDIIRDEPGVYIL